MIFVLRKLGLRRMTVFGLGFVTGLLVAPMTGRQLRARIRERIEEA